MLNNSSAPVTFNSFRTSAEEVQFCLPLCIRLFVLQQRYGATRTRYAYLLYVYQGYNTYRSIAIKSKQEAPSPSECQHVASKVEYWLVKISLNPFGEKTSSIHVQVCTCKRSQVQYYGGRAQSTVSSSQQGPKDSVLMCRSVDVIYHDKTT